jgi:hypothetical protein
MGYGRGSIPGRDKTFFFTPQRPRRQWSHLAAYLASYPMGTGVSFPAI